MYCNSTESSALLLLSGEALPRQPMFHGKGTKLPRKEPGCDLERVVSVLEAIPLIARERNMSKKKRGSPFGHTAPAYHIVLGFYLPVP